jgi:hypothetical protein
VEHHGVQRTLDKLRQQGVHFDGVQALQFHFDFVGTFAHPRIIHLDHRMQFLNDMITSLIKDGLFGISAHYDGCIERGKRDRRTRKTTFAFTMVVLNIASYDGRSVYR